MLNLDQHESLKRLNSPKLTGDHKGQHPFTKKEGPVGNVAASAQLFPAWSTHGRSLHSVGSSHSSSSMACCKAPGFWPSTVQRTAKQVPRISLAVPLNSLAKLFFLICRQMSRNTSAELKKELVGPTGQQFPKIFIFICTYTPPNTCIIIYLHIYIYMYLSIYLSFYLSIYIYISNTTWVDCISLIVLYISPSAKYM